MARKKPAPAPVVGQDPAIGGDETIIGAFRRMTDEECDAAGIPHGSLAMVAPPCVPAPWTDSHVTENKDGLGITRSAVRRRDEIHWSAVVESVRGGVKAWENGQVAANEPLCAPFGTVDAEDAIARAVGRCTARVRAALEVGS